MCYPLDVLLPVITTLINTSDVRTPVVAAAVPVVKPLTAEAAELVVKAAAAAVEGAALAAAAVVVVVKTQQQQ